MGKSGHDNGNDAVRSRDNGKRQQNRNGGNGKRGGIVVDGSNVAWEEQSADGKPQLKNLLNMRNLLEKEGFDPVIVVVDAALHHQVDDPDELDTLIDQGVILQAPAGTDADYFVLKTAHDRDTPFVSNDVERDYRDEFTHLRERRIPYMIVAGHIELYEPYVKKALEFVQR